MSKNFVIVINAVNIKSAGGLTVALNFLNIVKSSKPEITLKVFCPKDCGFESYEGQNIYIQYVPKFMESPLQRLWGDHLWLNRKIKQISPDIVLTMGNIAIPTRYKQGVIFMWPYAIYPNEKYAWQLLGKLKALRHRLVIEIFKSRLKYTDIVFPQTKTSRLRLAKYYPGIKKMHIVPMAYSAIGQGDGKNNYGENFFERKENYTYLLCLTRYYTHKNVEIFLELGKLFVDNNAPYKIITTIDPLQSIKSKSFVENINKLGLSEVIINLGTIPINKVPLLYSQVDALLLPTLLESFSATYADSLFLKKPIFTSDKDFAKDVCEDCAYYFDPLSAYSIYKVIEEAYKNKSQMETKVNKGYERVNDFPDWNQVADMYVEQLKRM